MVRVICGRIPAQYDKKIMSSVQPSGKVNMHTDKVLNKYIKTTKVVNFRKTADKLQDSPSSVNVDPRGKINIKNFN